MALVPNNIINKYKSAVDVAAIINEADRTSLLLTTLQHKCLFEILIYPEKFPSPIDPVGVTLATMDLIIARLYLYAINDVPIIGQEYQRSGGYQFVKDLVYPDSFTCTFLESGLGVVKRYFRTWQDLIATYNPSLNDYTFNDDQNISKRTAILIPQQSDVIPSLEWIKIDGMKIKSITGIGYDHASGENEIITAEFSCDNIRLSPGTPI